MFDQLLDLVRQHSQEAVVNNPDIPNEHNEAVIQETGHSIMDTLRSLLAGGRAKDVMGLFGGNGDNVNNSPVTSLASNNLVGSLMQKFGLSSEKAGGIAASLIPMVLGSLVRKTNDPNNNSFSLQNIFNSLSNNGTSGLDIGGLFSKFTGGGTSAGSSAGGAGSSMLDRDGDGDVDLSDLTAAFSGTKTAGQDPEAGGGGMLDKLKGLFGN